MEQIVDSLPTSVEKVVDVDTAPVEHVASVEAVAPVEPVVPIESVAPLEPVVPDEPIASYNFLSKLYSSFLFLLASFFNLFNRKNVILNTASASIDSSLNSDTTK